MTGSNLRIFACDNFKSEFERVLDGGNFQEVELSTFPCRCYGPLPVDSAKLRENLLSCMNGDDSVLVIIGTCLDATAAIEEEEGRVKCIRLENCFEILAPETLIDAVLGEGGYLMTPGWLREWPRHMEDWGFDRETASAYFKESISKLVLLDTGIDEDAAGNLRSLGDFLQLPYQIIPVGLAHLRFRLESVVSQWRLEKQEKKSLDMQGKANRESADYAMILDLLSSMAEVRTKDEVVQAMFDLIGMLFAPAGQIYVSLFDNRPGKIWSRPLELKNSAVDMARLASQCGENNFAANGRGFVVSIHHQGDCIGVLEVQDVGFPKYIEDHISVAISITHICGLAFSNARSFEDLLLANSELEVFAHTASHDLKGPLANISVASKMLQDMIKGQDSEGKKDQIIEMGSLMENSARKSMELIDFLLRFAKAGSEPQEVSQVSVGKIVEEIVEEKAIIISESGARVTIGDELGQIFGNEVQVYQLFVNLIDNAIRYADPNDPRVEVMCLGEDPHGGLRYMVRDNGPGIPEEDLERIFEPFFKGENGQNGLGLAIVDKIIKTYNGEIRAYNDGGACFEFVLRNIKKGVPRLG